MNEILEKVYQFAARAHGEQRRKYIDEPYINHPVRVMEICQVYNKSIPVSAAALLHDVIEDTPVTNQELKEFLDSIMDDQDALKTALLVKDLTDVYTHDSHPELNRRRRKTRELERLKKAHPDAQTIKYADIIDNSESISGAGDEFAPVYLNECRLIIENLKNGNSALRQRAIAAVELAINKISEP